MNNDLISKKDFLDLFYVASAGQDTAFIEAVEMVVADTPAVDAVVHGEWELHGNDGDIGGSYWCSRCHANYDEDLFYDGWLDDYHPFNFCPNCGADMRERKGDDG